MVSRSRATICSRAFVWEIADLDLALSRSLKVPQTLNIFTHSVNRILTSTFRRLPLSILRNSLRRDGSRAHFRLVHHCEYVLSTSEFGHWCYTAFLSPLRRQHVKWMEQTLFIRLYSRPLPTSMPSSRLCSTLRRWLLQPSSIRQCKMLCKKRARMRRELRLGTCSTVMAIHSKQRWCSVQCWRPRTA